MYSKLLSVFRLIFTNKQIFYRNYVAQKQEKEKRFRPWCVKQLGMTRRLKILRSGRNCICSLAGTQKIPHTSKDATTWRCSRLAKISNESWSS
jgi:hypothetical protein